MACTITQGVGAKSRFVCGGGRAQCCRPAMLPAAWSRAGVCMRPRWLLLAGQASAAGCRITGATAAREPAGGPAWQSTGSAPRRRCESCEGWAHSAAAPARGRPVVAPVRVERGKRFRPGVQQERPRTRQPAFTRCRTCTAGDCVVAEAQHPACPVTPSWLSPSSPGRRRRSAAPPRHGSLPCWPAREAAQGALVLQGLHTP